MTDSGAACVRPSPTLTAMQEWIHYPKIVRKRAARPAARATEGSLMALKVDVDMDLCQSHGECVFAAPEVFELDDDDQLHWVAGPDESLREKVQQAEKVCPVSAIRVTG
jgi:ferredoxin